MNPITTYQNFIGGRFQIKADAELMDVINPESGEVISRVPKSSVDDVKLAVDKARSAQPGWASLTSKDRARYLVKLSDEIRNKKKELAIVISSEQGKIISQAEAEVETSAEFLQYMAGWARRIEGEIIESDRERETIYLSRRPIGVVGAILPWNFPFFLAIRKLAPVLMTGNAIVIKSSEETPNSSFEIAKLIEKVGLPPGVCNIVSGDGRVGEYLCDSTSVNMVSFTGSVDTGKKIMAACAKNLTKVNLELGGKAPAIVTAKANIDLAVEAIVKSKILNSGQACICAERIYVEKDVADILIEKLVAAMKKVRFGCSWSDADKDMGPLVNQQTLQKVEGMVQRAKEQGAQILCGGEAASGETGFHYLPTVMLVNDNAMEIMQKEIFGPVVPMMVVEDLEEAVRLSNDSIYGLSSSVYSRDADELSYACRHLEFGEVYVNRENIETMQGYHAGRRQSGIGGTDGKHGLYDYMETQVVYWQSGR